MQIDDRGAAVCSLPRRDVAARPRDDYEGSEPAHKRPKAATLAAGGRCPPLRQPPDAQLPPAQRNCAHGSPNAVRSAPPDSAHGSPKAAGGCVPPASAHGSPGISPQPPAQSRSPPPQPASPSPAPAAPAPRAPRLRPRKRIPPAPLRPGHTPQKQRGPPITATPQRVRASPASINAGKLFRSSARLPVEDWQRCILNLLDRPQSTTFCQCCLCGQVRDRVFMSPVLRGHALACGGCYLSAWTWSRAQKVMQAGTEQGEMEPGLRSLQARCLPHLVAVLHRGCPA